MTPKSGFTLLELLIVLVILGLTASFVSPALWRSYEKSQQRSVLQKFAQSLEQYRIQAYRTGRPIELLKEPNNPEKSTALPLPSLPNGWAVEKATPLRFLPSGVTNGAEYHIKSPDRRWILKITPLDGEHEINLL